jgi:hypothetical protein
MLVPRCAVLCLLISLTAVLAERTPLCMGRVSADRGEGRPRTAEPETRRVALRDTRFDTTTGKIVYTLPEACVVTVYIGVEEGGPLLRILVDHELQEAGTHEVTWDGWDGSREVNFLGKPGVVASVNAVALGEGTAVRNGGHYTGSDRESAFDLRLLEGANGGNEDNEKIQAIRDRLSIQVSLARRDWPALVGGQYEWLFFIDNQFLYEESAPKADPYVIEFDVSPLAEGEHLLTVNLCDARDLALATRSRRFLVTKGTSHQGGTQ